MQLREIIKISDSTTGSLSIETVARYRRSLLTVYGSEAIVLVTCVTNNSCYCKVVSADNFSEAVYHYVESLNLENEEETENETELINAQSIFLKNL